MVTLDSFKSFVNSLEGFSLPDDGRDTVATADSQFDIEQKSGMLGNAGRFSRDVVLIGFDFIQQIQRKPINALVEHVRFVIFANIVIESSIKIGTGLLGHGVTTPKLGVIFANSPQGFVILCHFFLKRNKNLDCG